MSYRGLFFSALPAAGLSLMTALPAQAQYSVGDREIDGSLCVGLDCVNGESFGFDTIRMKENNVRLHYLDTSASASFPSNDWRVEINASANGGSNHYAIQDATAGRNVALIEAGAPANALRIESNGNVGLSEPNPVVELHIADGDSPTVRLEQDGSSGFAPQTWDVAGNETNFFVRDVTHGSALPLRVRPSAPTSSIDIAADGDVGMGIANPDSALHIRRATGAAADMLKLENNGGSFITLENTSSGRDWFFTHENGAAGRFIINASTNGADGLFLDPDGDMTIGGTLTENSDKNAKMAIVPVDEAAILDKVAELPVSTWTYKDDTSGARHVGPMAQDFYAAFGLGHTETGIATLDTSGVALASIKALHTELDEAHAEIAGLKASHAAQITALMARLSALEAE